MGKKIPAKFLHGEKILRVDNEPTCEKCYFFQDNRACIAPPWIMRQCIQRGLCFTVVGSITQLKMFEDEI